MTVTVSSIEDILAALLQVQEAVRIDIAARIAAGETIVGSDGGREFHARKQTLSRSKRRHAGLVAETRRQGRTPTGIANA